MMNLDIYYYLIMNCLIKFVIRLNILYLTSEKSDITDSANHNFGEIRIDSYNSLPIEKILTFHNVMILIKSVVNKNKNEYILNTFHEYINTHNVFLEKGSCKDKSYTQYF